MRTFVHQCQGGTANLFTTEPIDSDDLVAPDKLPLLTTSQQLATAIAEHQLAASSCQQTTDKRNQTTGSWHVPAASRRWHYHRKQKRRKEEKRKEIDSSRQIEKLSIDSKDLHFFLLLCKEKIQKDEKKEKKFIDFEMMRKHE